MPRGKSNRSNSRNLDSKNSNRSGGRRNISSRRDLGTMNDETQRKNSTRSGRAPHDGARERSDLNE